MELIATTFLKLMDDPGISMAVNDLNQHIEDEQGIHIAAYALSRAYLIGVNDGIIKAIKTPDKGNI